MDRSRNGSVENIEFGKSEILKNRLLSCEKPTGLNCRLTQSIQDHNATLNSIRSNIGTSMLVPSVQSTQGVNVSHNILPHSIAPVKIQSNNIAGYPLQLQLGAPSGMSTVNVPVQLPGSTTNINVPVQLTTNSSSVPLHMTAPVTLPLQVSASTTNVPVQLPAGGTINVPLQIPNTNIHINSPSVPIIQNTNPIIHVHMGANQPRNNMDIPIDANNSASQLHIENNQVRGANSNQNVQVHSNPVHLQIPSSSVNTPMQLQLPSATSRNNSRTIPHMVYIQAQPTQKSVDASATSNPPPIIVRRSVSGNQNIQFVANKTNIAPKPINKTSVLAGNGNQPIVIKNSKLNSSIGPVSLAPTAKGKQAIAYLGTVKKSTVTKPEGHSILIPNKPPNVAPNGNQKVFIAPVNMPKLQNKFILPMNMPGSMTTKGPIINLQISNGQLQNDAQGAVTIMRDGIDNESIPALQVISKPQGLANGNDTVGNNIITTTENTYSVQNIPGSRAEPTGEQEYTLSIPDTNSSINDDIYTVSISDENGDCTKQESFTLTIPEKSKSLLNKVTFESKIHENHMPIPAPAILRRSNSETSDKRSVNLSFRRRISLCSDASSKMKIGFQPLSKFNTADFNSNDERVPSLFCDEKLDKDLESKSMHVDSEKASDNKDDAALQKAVRKIEEDIKKSGFIPIEHSNRVNVKRGSTESIEEDLGLTWNGDGMAALTGSNLKFSSNEFGLLELVDSDQDDSIKNFADRHQNDPAKNNTDYQRQNKIPSPEDMFVCKACGCHGMAGEFVTPSFCSLACQNVVEKAENKRRNREFSELLRQRTRQRKLLMQQKISKIPYKGNGQQENIEHVMESSRSDSNNDEHSNDKYPWMCGNNGFSWLKYLEFTKSKEAPLELFKDRLSCNKNGFKVGMKLEAIDPMHASMFSVVSVVEVQGYRLRLHFDSYPDTYDFWVNANCIDIFPPGWCDLNKKPLTSPVGFSHMNFSWPLYLKQTKSIGAPKHLFPHLVTMMMKPSGFEVGMKLEAEDKKNNLICVATVADTLDNRILINFDSWDEMYDYWVDPTSPYIHPVGYAEANNLPLTPPNFYKDPESFTWQGYLESTKSAPVPERAFTPRAPLAFRVGMKLEAVDKRVPFLIRVATVSEVKPYQVRVSFDGWPDELSCWYDDDSPDLHPVGWCLRTGHPLEPPLTAEQARAEGRCGTAGCRGLGSLRGGDAKTHAAAALCPYRPHSPAPPPDRLAPHARPTRLLPRPKKGRPPKYASSVNSTDSKPMRGRPPKHKRIDQISKADSQVSDAESVASSLGGGGSKRSRRSGAGDEGEGEGEGEAEGEGEGEGEGEAQPGEEVVGARSLPHLLARLMLPPDPLSWTEMEVVDFIKCIVPSGVADRFVEHRISGEELLMLSQEEMVQALGLKLGPAIKLYNLVLQLRNTLS